RPVVRRSFVGSADQNYEGEREHRVLRYSTGVHDLRRVFSPDVRRWKEQRTRADHGHGAQAHVPAAVRLLRRAGNELDESEERMNQRTFSEQEQVDFVIVGSGASGGVLAKELSTAGFKVVVLEQGPFRKSSDFQHDELGNWILGSLLPS